MITISIGRPEDDQRPTTTIPSRTLVVLGAGIAAGIILKQRADIRTLSTTVRHLQEIIR